MSKSSKEVIKNRGPEYFMGKALDQARKAMAEKEIPIGAVIVKDGQIIARAYNQREGRQDASLHAEMTAIKGACKKLSSWRLDGCDIYVNLEPCPMCAGAIQQARIRKLYFGVKQDKSGAVVSKTRILDLNLNHKVDYEGGLMADQSLELIQSFFKEKRKEIRDEGLTKGQRKSIRKSL